MTSNIPRREYPRPQLIRKDWLNLNGEWSFNMDLNDSGIDKALYETRLEGQKIIVPFCPESKLSGIGYTDFMPVVWYQRQIEIPAQWQGKRIRLHFGAVDYHTIVWVNGKEVGKHKGGYTPFWFDITNHLTNEDNIITVCAKDDVRSMKQPRGKQSSKYSSRGCDYTRTTGIWQTVWLEPVDDICINNIKLTPLVSDGGVNVEIETTLPADAAIVTIKFGADKVAKKTISFDGNRAISTIELSQIYLWSVGKGNLYDVDIEIISSNTITDIVSSYFGMRSISWDKKGIKINGKYVFQRLVLDQGFYPDGIYTAPSDEDLKKDIELSLALGFNGARLHEKIFEPRFLYWADKYGYLCWGEHGNWGLDITSMEGLRSFLPEWMEALNRDYNHPSIIGWCPFNETWDKGNSQGNSIPQDNDVLRFTYMVTKQIDKTRPVIDTSGNYHVITDVFDIHDYTQEVNVFKNLFKGLESGEDVYVTFPNRQHYEDQPYFVSEYGGIWWAPDKVDEGWGYGGVDKRPKNKKEFISRYKGLTEALLQNKGVCAFCYTQLYDIEQEVNGLYTYDRKIKFSTDEIAAINKQIAEIEK